MIKPFVIAGIVLILVLLGFLSRRGKPELAAYAVPDGAQPGDLTSLEPYVYRPGKKLKFNAERGTLTVPENWDDPNSRLIGLPVVRIPATHPDPAEPVFVLLGGPGASNQSFAPKDWLLENHDVILVGYRGVDGSVDLNCPEVSKISAKYLGKGFLNEAANAELVGAAKRCAEKFRVAGVDLRGYTAKGVVEDMEAARKALGYERINLWSESYGTRVAQLYAYMVPGSLHRTLMIGMNTPGHFVYDPAVLDKMIHHISALCAKDPDCSSRAKNLAQAIYNVNHNMPERWLFFPIDPGSIRMITHMMFFSNPTMPMVLDAYLAAVNGDPSGLAMLNFIGPFVFPFEMFHMGDFLNKGGTLDLEYYRGPESIRLGDSMMGAPLAEWVWPMAAEWPIEPVEASLRQLQESDVDMLVVNGTVDFSTPPTALDELKPYYHNAQTVLLPEFSHVGDVVGLQPEAFKRLVTSYYDTGVADASLFVYQPVSLKPKMRLAVMAKLLVAVMVIFPPLLIAVLVIIARRSRRKTGKVS
jgi:pimeloyl-ACP methyl ester carboxylesterase